MDKLLHCPCELSRECGTMIQESKLHEVLYSHKFHEFIHSKDGLNYLLSNFDGKTEIVAAINHAYQDLK